MKILKASAGSGKTFTLSKHFIELLLRSDDRYAYRHILAVTFTNKATEEMKSRILADLYRMSASDPRARRILTDILHDYSAFSVSTIDSFFQHTLRAFTREIGQFADYQIELDRESVIVEAMDRVLDSLSDDNRELLGWVIESVVANLSQGKKTRLEEGFYDMGRQFKSHELTREMEACGLSREEAFSKSRLKSVTAVCRKIVTEFENKCRDMGVKVVRGKELDFTKAFAGMEDEYDLYYTANAIRGSLYNLGLAGEFFSAFDSILREKNVMCLDDSNQILKGIIDGSDAPFIYEKTGVRYDHFLLDEFQDTSVIQWENFKPLIDESESRGGGSLVVGDVKQSIYRWRNSEWRLLSEVVPSQYPAARTDSLKSNWRSAAVIVDFNNALFKFAGELMGYADIYSDVYQEKASGDTGGMVKVTCSVEQLDAVSASIDAARAAGASWADIAVLVRTNDQGREVAGMLVERGVPVISDDSLDVLSSIAVRQAISALSFIDNPNDGINAYLASLLSLDLKEKHHSLYDLCEHILRDIGRACGGYEGQELYVQAFLDEVQRWTKTNGGSIRPFIEHMGKASLTVACPQDADAVRVMTIHKSKGLQFPYVIVPFVESMSTSKPHTHWCAIRDDEAGLRGVYPVTLKEAMSHSLFRGHREEEQRMAGVDNLNSLYVACTRAVKVLHLITKGAGKTFKTSKNPEVKNMAQLLYRYFGCDEKTFGDMPRFEAAAGGKGSDAEFRGGFASYALNGRLLPSELAADYFSEEGVFGGGSSSPRLDGIALHSVLSAVRTASDLDRALARAVHGGELTPEEAKPAEVLLRRALESRPDWFKAGSIVLNETPVIVPGASSAVEKRPDRVLISGDNAIVIDCKFGSANPAYRRQVQ
ncbi:MAG: UvrD-helicase domain-containing protein, partial [Bacteroidales bacterium]|nr:UvrD-helicase domain-containing protein [Bacteroidales bacterium]